MTVKIIFVGQYHTILEDKIDFQAILQNGDRFELGKVCISIYCTFNNIRLAVVKFLLQVNVSNALSVFHPISLEILFTLIDMHVTPLCKHAVRAQCCVH